MSSTLSVHFPGAFVIDATLETENAVLTKNVEEDAYSESISESESFVTAMEDEEDAVVPLGRVISKFPHPKPIVDKAVGEQPDSLETLVTMPKITPRRASSTMTGNRKTGNRTPTMGNYSSAPYPVTSKRALGQGVILGGNEGSLSFDIQPRSSGLAEHSRNASTTTLSILASVPDLDFGRSSTDPVSTIDDHMQEMFQRYRRESDCGTLEARASTAYSCIVDPERPDRVPSPHEISKVVTNHREMAESFRPASYKSSAGHRGELARSPSPMTPCKSQRQMPDTSPITGFLQSDPFMAATPSPTRPESTYTTVSSMFAREFRDEGDVFRPRVFVQPDPEKHKNLFLPEPAVGKGFEKNSITGKKSMRTPMADSSTSSLASSTTPTTHTMKVSQAVKTLTRHLSAVNLTDINTAASKTDELSDDEPTEY